MFLSYWMLNLRST